MKRYLLFILLVIIVVYLTGCDKVYRSRISIRTKPASVQPSFDINITTRDVESTIKKFTLLHVYKIEEIDKNDPWIKQEINGDKPTIIWVAEKNYEPTIIFTSIENVAVVRLIKLSGPIRPKLQRMYTEELYSLVKNKFGAGNVDLVEN